MERRRAARVAEPGVDARMTAGQEIVQHRHLREQLAVLERAREPEPRDLMRRAAADHLPEALRLAPNLQVAQTSAGQWAISARGYQVGGIVKAGAGEFKLGYSMYKTDATRNPEARKVAVGYVHNLSKRTAVYATFARLKNKNGASFALQGATTAPNTSSSGYDLGIRHTF